MMFLKWLGSDPEKHSVRTEMLAGLTTFLTMVVMPFCFNISDGILIGLISYVLLNAFWGNLKNITPTMWVLTILFILRYIFI